MSIAIKNNIRDPYVHSANYSLCIFCSQLLFLSSTGQSLLLTPFTFSHTDTAQPAGHWRIIIKMNYPDHYVQSRNYSLCVFCSQLWNLSSNGLTPLPTSDTFNSTDTSQPAGHWPPMDPQVPSCMKLLAYRHPLSRPIQSLSESNSSCEPSPILRPPLPLSSWLEPLLDGTPVPAPPQTFYKASSPK